MELHSLSVDPPIQNENNLHLAPTRGTESGYRACPIPKASAFCGTPAKEFLVR